MKQIKTAGKDLIVVEVPEDAYDFDVIMKERMYIVFRTDNKVNEINTTQSTLKRYKILGKLSELSEEECERFVKEGSYMKTYWNYITNDNHKSNQLKTPKESLISLLQYKDIDTSKNPLIIEVL